MVESWGLPACLPASSGDNWKLPAPRTQLRRSFKATKRAKGSSPHSTSQRQHGQTVQLLLLAHLGHPAAASANRPSTSWTHPAGLFWGSQSEEGLLGISAALSYSSRSFCPKGSFDVQNRLWCHYESSIVRLGTDNALGRLFIYKSTQCSPLPYSLQMQIERPSSCKPNRLA